MGYIGSKPSAVPLTSADITDGIITSAKIVDGTIAIADLSATGTPSSSTFLRGDNTWNTPSSSFVFLGETTASNVASVSLNGYFTSDYDIYKIFIDGWYGSSSADGQMTFNTTGSYTEQTSNYGYINGIYVDSTSFVGDYWNRGYSTSYIGLGAFSNTQSTGGSAELTLYNPMSTTYYKYYTGLVSSNYSTYLIMGHACGVWKDTTAITGIRFKMSSGNIYARKIKIYGVKNT